MGAGPLGGEVEEGAAVFLKKVGKGSVIGDIQQVPVVQPRPFQLAVVNGEAHGADEVEPGAGDGAGAGDVAGVLGDLRLDENEVEGGHGTASLERLPALYHLSTQKDKTLG